MQKVASRLLSFFLQGLLIVVPITVTLYLIYWLFTTIDNILPIFTRKDTQGNIINENYGLGFLVIIISIAVIGYLSSNFIAKNFFKIFDSWLEKTPGIKLVYTTIKDFIEAFAGEKRKFTKPVRVLIRRNPELWQMGFITQEDISKIAPEEMIAVYMPHSYAVSGILYLVERKNVVAIESIDAANTMKMIISGGVAGYEDVSEKEQEDFISLFKKRK